MISDDALLDPAAEQTGCTVPDHILIVDDDKSQVEILSYALRRQGYRVDTAHSIQAGLGMLQQEKPKLLILDIRLPDGDGLSLCHRLSDDALTQHIPVVILSGMEDAHVVRRARAAGCQYYLRKPYDPNTLLLLVENAIREAAGW